MNKHELNLILQEGESLTVEFKQTFSNKIDRDMVALANTRGGYILLGIEDKTHNVMGATLTNDLKAKIHDLARNCEPSIAIANVEQIDNIIAIKISDSPEKPHCCSAGYFRRLNGATQKMNQRELKLIFKQRDQRPPYEEQICESASLADVSEDKIRNFLSMANIHAEASSPLDILHNLNLVSEHGISNAAMLCFAKHPRNHIFHCEMVLAAFKGNDGVNIYDRINIQDDLLTQFNQAISFFTKHLNVRSEIIGVQRHDICEIPLEALREATANAIIHRDYAMRGTSIIIEIHENRVSISNPGGIPNGISIHDIQKRSIRRNERIADLFARIDKAERMASGIKRIMKFTAEAGLPAPDLKSDEFFEIIFARDPKYKVHTHPNTTPIDLEHLKNHLSTRQLEILRALENHKLTPSEIIDQLEQPVSSRTLRRDLQTLKEQALIDAEGPEGWARKWFLKH